jgi:hypothetical protein
LRLLIFLYCIARNIKSQFSETLLFLLLRPEINISNELRYIEFLFPDYPAFLSTRDWLRFCKRSIIIFIESDTQVLISWQVTLKPCTLLYFALHACAYNIGDTNVYTVYTFFTQKISLPMHSCSIFNY